MATPTSIERLPPLPGIAIDLLNRISDCARDRNGLIDLLSEQPQLRSEVTQVATQMYLQPAGHNVAVQASGGQSLLEQVDWANLAEIAITVLVRGYLRRALSVSEDYRYWRYTLACAVCCEQVAVGREEDSLLAYTAGLLHDIGRLALIAAYPNQYSNLLTLTDRMFAANEPFDFLEYERLLFGFDHFTTGAWVARVWKLPSWLHSIVGKFDEQASPERAKLVSTVRAGTRLAHSLGFGYLQSAPRADIKEILGQFPDAEKHWQVLDSWEYAEETLRGKVRSRLQSYAAAE